MSQRPRQRRRPARDPYAGAPTDELSDPVLPRWFVLVAVISVPVAIGVFAVAFPLLGGDDEVPPAERRPPPPADGELTHGVGEVRLGRGETRPADPGCAAAQGLVVAGGEPERQRLRTAVEALCALRSPAGAGPAITELADAGAVIRFAGFTRPGVPSTVDVAADPPRVLINVSFTRVQRPEWITPLIVHDAVTVAGEPGTVETALAARRAELATCQRLLDPATFPVSCETARRLLGRPDPAAALRRAGYE